MHKSVRITPESDASNGQAVTFTLAVGPVRQVCRLMTSFRTQNQAFSYLHRNRAEFEHIARARFAAGDIEDGVINLVML